ncbi:linear amide C-N hydrolase [Aestuariivirga sp.]|jgi:choloylglycine hydrolase|uniref:linear amide C-N hydrolase n=1 Tax=Aestuariivirga sp. TaxID=2650926 RepID=UPI00378396BF
MRTTLFALAALGSFAIAAPLADACTRIVYNSGDSFFVGRSMDWAEETGTDLWAFPSGLRRDGGVGEGSITWTSKYGSVIAGFYNVGTVDGVNEAGLVGNVLYLVESDYGDAKASGRPLLSVGGWLQYVLDNYATVAEAVDALSQEPFAIVAPVLPNGKAGAGHLSIADKAGDSAIFEYIGGRLVIHHNKSYTVMTNSPTFDQQLAISTYWNTVGGINFLPGTSRASDRFARMDWMLNAVPQVKDAALASATVMSLMRSISVPLGVQDPTLPNIAATRWRTAVDINAGRYFFDSVHFPTVFWVDLPKLNLKPGAPALKLDLQGRPLLSGEVSASFKPAEPFKFLSPKG